MSMNTEYELVMTITSFYSATKVPGIQVVSAGSFLLPSDHPRKALPVSFGEGTPHCEKGCRVPVFRRSAREAGTEFCTVALYHPFAHWCYSSFIIILIWVMTQSNVTSVSSSLTNP